MSAEPAKEGQAVLELAWQEVARPHYEAHPLVLPPDAHVRSWRTRGADGKVHHLAGGDGLAQRILAVRPLWVECSATQRETATYLETPFYVTDLDRALQVALILQADFGLTPSQMQLVQASEDLAVLAGHGVFRSASKSAVRRLLAYFSGAGFQAPPGHRRSPHQRRYWDAYAAILDDWASMSPGHLALHMAAKTPLQAHLLDPILADPARRIEAAVAVPRVHRLVDELARRRCFPEPSQARALNGPWIPLPGSIHALRSTVVQTLRLQEKGQGGLAWA